MNYKLLEHGTAIVIVVLLLALTMGNAVHAQGTIPSLPEMTEEALVWSQGYQTYVLLDRAGSIGMQLNTAIRWAWICLGVLPAKVVPVTVAGREFLCVMFRAVTPVPLFVCPAALMSFPYDTHLRNNVNGWVQTPRGDWIPTRATI
jgi:hypothetical protein